MNLSLDFNALVELQKHAGTIDSDSGRVFVNAACHRQGDLYVGEALFRSAGPADQGLESFSIAQVLGEAAEAGGPESEVNAAHAVVELDDTDELPEVEDE